MDTTEIAVEPSQPVNDVPESNADLMRWHGLIYQVGRKTGVPTPDLDDFVSKVLLDFIENDYLTKYDSAKASFTSFLYAFAAKRAMGIRDRAYRQIKHERQTTFTDAYEEDDPTAIRAPADPIDEIGLLGDQEQVDALLAILKAIQPYETLVYTVRRAENNQSRTHTVTVQRSLYTLLQLLLDGYTQREIAKVYGRSLGTVSSMVSDLRKNPAVVRAMLGIPRKSR